MDTKEYINRMGELCGNEQFTKYFYSEHGLAQLSEIAKQMSGSDRYDKEITVDHLQTIVLERPMQVFKEMKMQSQRVKGIDGLIDVELGLLPLRDFNAFAARSSNGKNVIIVDLALKNALFELCCSLIGYAYLSQEKLITEELLQILISGFLNTTLEFLGGKKAFGDEFESTILDPENSILPMYYIEVAAALSESIYLFTLAHEYSHHLLGHLDGHKTKKAVAYNLDVEIDFFVRRTNQELEADSLAIKIFNACQDSSHEFILFSYLNTYFYAPYLFFDILDTVYHVLNIGTDSIGTHPPPLTRRNNLLFPRINENLSQHAMYPFLKDYIEAMKAYQGYIKL